MNHIQKIKVPEFWEFILTPKSSTCKVIEKTRIWVEILWWLHGAEKEFEWDEFERQMKLDGDYSILLRYKREKDGKYRVAWALSYNEDESGNVMITQIQGSTDKHVAFRFHSSFDKLWFYKKVIEESFSKKGIYVEVIDLPNGLENASYSSKAWWYYDNFRRAIEWLNKKYSITKK